jgi:hypothetical protein
MKSYNVIEMQLKNLTLRLHHWGVYDRGSLDLLSAFALFLTFATFGGRFVSWDRYVVHITINISMQSNIYK